ncbi:MAG: glycosyltransferase family 39 protein [Oscillospiraceae bacterium]|nr:glycosyltransferase family 39 protein [Oscillospiraceae bacterium]
MDKLQNSKEKLKYGRLCFWLILALGIFARAFQFGSIPAGINQDEAFAAYEAWSLLKYGVDTAGYHNPVYLTAWGSGMNALESYLMMPFIALFGLEVWAIRMPQLIVAILSIWVVYLLVRRLVNEKAGLIAMLMLAICPWHILMSRWGLESNMAPGFLLFGLYFFVKGLEKPEFLPLSALMYGLSLYAYATYWIYIPFIILFQLIYAIACGKIRFDRYLVLSGVVLAALATPLLLFLAINNGYMEEIILPFMSIPKILYMRTSEISFEEKARKLELIKDIFVEQSDGWIWNSPSKFGLFYFISAPFAIFGLCYCIVRIVKCIREKRFCPEVFVLIQLLIALPQLILVKINVNKVNILFIPIVILIALGIYFACSLTFRHVLTAVIGIYLVLFAGFEHYYFTEYNDECNPHFDYGMEEALELAMEKGDRVYFEPGTYYPKILFYTEYPVEQFREEVDYLFYPSPYLVAVEFGRFSLWYNPHMPDPTGAYVLRTGVDMGVLAEEGFTLEQFGVYTVAYK